MPAAFAVICYDETVGDGLGSAQEDVHYVPKRTLEELILNK